MKKLVLAMACVLSLGLLASCKQGVQDVSVKDANDTEASAFYGEVEGTFTCQKTTGSGDTLAYTADDAATHATLAPSSNWKFSEISWKKESEKVDTNYTTYTLTVQFAKSSTASNATSEEKAKTFTFYKIGDKYYMNDYVSGPQASQTKKAELSLTGTPEDSEFTVADFGYIAFGSDVFTAKNVKFTRK